MTPREVKQPLKSPQTIQQMQVDPRLASAPIPDDIQDQATPQGERPEIREARRPTLLEREEASLKELESTIRAVGHELLALYAEAATIQSRITWIKTTPGAEVVLQQIIDREVARKDSTSVAETQRVAAARVKEMLAEFDEPVKTAAATA